MDFDRKLRIYGMFCLRVPVFVFVLSLVLIMMNFSGSLFYNIFVLSGAWILVGSIVYSVMAKRHWIAVILIFLIVIAVAEFYFLFFRDRDFNSNRAGNDVPDNILY